MTMSKPISPEMAMVTVQRQENLPTYLLGARPIQESPTPSPVHSPCPALSALLAPEFFAHLFKFCIYLA